MVYTAVEIQENTISYVANFENLPYIQGVRLDNWVGIFTGDGSGGGLSAEMQAYINDRIDTALASIGVTTLIDRVSTLETEMTSLKSRVNTLETKNILVFKGIVASVNLLPSSGNASGDLYLVGSSSDSNMTEYVFISSLNRFEEFGSISSSVGGTYTTEQIDAMISELRNKIVELDQINALDAVVLSTAKEHADSTMSTHLSSELHVPGYGTDKQILSTQTINNTKVLMWQTFEENDDKHVKQLTYDTDTKDLSVTMTDDQTLTVSLSKIYTDFGIADTIITNMVNDLSDELDSLELSYSTFKESITTALSDVIANDIYLASVNYDDDNNKIIFTMSNSNTHEVTLKEELNYHISSVKLENSSLIFKFNTSELVDICVDISSVVGSTTDTFISEIELDSTDLTFTYNNNDTKVIDFAPIVNLAVLSANTYTDSEIAKVMSKIGVKTPAIDEVINTSELISFEGNIYKCVNAQGSTWTGSINLDFEKYISDTTTDIEHDLSLDNSTNNLKLTINGELSSADLSKFDYEERIAMLENSSSSGDSNITAGDGISILDNIIKAKIETGRGLYFTNDGAMTINGNDIILGEYDPSFNSLTLGAKLESLELGAIRTYEDDGSSKLQSQAPGSLYILRNLNHGEAGGILNMVEPGSNSSITTGLVSPEHQSLDRFIDVSESLGIPSQTLYQGIKLLKSGSVLELASFVSDSPNIGQLVKSKGNVYYCIKAGSTDVNDTEYYSKIGDVDLSSVYTKDEIDDKLSNLDSGSTIETKTISTDTIASDTEITVTLPENETYSDYLSFELISNDSESSGYLSYAKASDTTINIYNVSNEELTYILRGIKGTASSTGGGSDPHFVDEAGVIPGFTNVKIIGGQTFEVDGDLTVNGGLNANYIKSNINNSTVTFNGSTHTLQNAIALASVSDLQEVTFEDTSVFNIGSKLTIDTYNHFSGILLINDSGTVKLNTNMLFDNEQILNASGFSNGTWTQLDNKVKILTNGDNTDIEILTADYSKIIINDYLVPDSYRTQFSGSLTIMQEAGNGSNISILANNCVVTDSSVTLSLGFKTSDEYVSGTELTFTLANVDSDRIFSSTVGNKNNCLRVNNTTNESEYIRAIFVLKRTESALTLTIKEYNSDTFLPGYSYYPYGTMSNPF